MAWRPARAPPAEARPSGRDGRRSARRSGGRRSARPDRRRRRGRRRGRAGAGCSATRCASADLVELDPELARLAEGNAARNGLQARTRVLRLDALNPKERREAGLAELAGCVVTNPPFFDAKAVRASPDEGKARAHVLPRAEAGAALSRLDSGFACDSRAGRAVCDDPPARGAERDPRRDRKPARRAGASAGSSDDRRERASPAGLGSERLQGPAAPCAGLSCTEPTAA